MIRLFTVLIALCAVSLSNPAFADEPVKPTPEKEHKCESCEKAKSGEAHWCAGCKKGWVKGKAVKCEACYKGQTGQDVWCDGCKAGYIGGEKVTCKTCFDHKANKGEACKEHTGKEG